MWHSYSGQFVRGFRSSAIQWKNNSEWPRKVSASRAREDEHWKRKTGANPSARLKGLGRALKAFDVDPESPEFRPEAFHSRGDPEEMLLNSAIQQKKFGLGLIGRKRNPNPLSPETVARIIHKQRFLTPKNQDPNLLTWMEKMTLRHLHQLDPIRWNAESLSEGFPATPAIIKKLLRIPNRVPPNKISSHDEQVRERWAKLAKNKLDLSPELRQHILDHFSLDKGLEHEIPPPIRNEMEQDIIKKYKESLRVLEQKPFQPGPFGNIVAQYNARLAAKNAPALGAPQTEEEEDLSMDCPVSMSESLFSSESEHNPEFNTSGPYGDTALLKSDLSSVRRDEAMTIADFRRNFLDQLTLSSNKEKQGGGHPYRTKMKKWLMNERLKDQATTVPQELAAGDILEELEEGKNIFEVPKYVPPSKSAARRREDRLKEMQLKIQKLRSDPKEKDRAKIDIPSDLYEPGAVYQVDNSFYDDKGEFMYKVLN